MMSKVLSRYNIAYKGLSLGGHSFDFQLDDDFFAAFESSEIEHGTADVHIDLERQSSMILASIEISGSVKVVCDRCLEDLDLQINYDDELIVRFTDEDIENDGDIIYLNRADDELPLAQYIYESVLLSLPYNRVHPTDGNGVSMCNPDMLARFTTLSEDEIDSFDEIDE